MINKVADNDQISFQGDSYIHWYIAVRNQVRTFDFGGSATVSVALIDHNVLSETRSTITTYY